MRNLELAHVSLVNLNFPKDQIDSTARSLVLKSLLKRPSVTVENRHLRRQLLFTGVESVVIFARTTILARASDAIMRPDRPIPVCMGHALINHSEPYSTMIHGIHFSLILDRSERIRFFKEASEDRTIGCDGQFLRI